MGWLGKRRRKKEEQAQEVVEAEAQESVTSGPEVLVLVPEVPGAPTFQVNRFHSADDAVAFVKATVTAELFPSTHIFWAMHEGPPPEVGPMGGEALVLIRAGDSREAVHVVSFVDLESAESFARFEVKRGLDVGFVLIYWAAFAQVIETPFGLRLDPPGPPDPRQWRAAAISASHAAPVPPIRRQPAAMQAGDDYGPELKLMRETKLPEAPPRAAPEPEPTHVEPRARPEPAASFQEDAPAAAEEPQTVAEQPETIAEEAQTIDAQPAEQEPQAPAFEPAMKEPAAEAPKAETYHEPEALADEPEPAAAQFQQDAPAAAEEPQTVAEQPETIAEEAQTIDAQPAEQEPDAPALEPAMKEPAAEPPEAETYHEPAPLADEPEPAAAEETWIEEQPTGVETTPEIEDETPADAEKLSVHLEMPADEPEVTDVPATDEAPALGEPAIDEEQVAVPPEFAAEPEEAVASTNGHHADEEIPDDFRIDGPVSSTEGDEEVAERLLTEALGTESIAEEPEPEPEAGQPVEDAVQPEPEPVAEAEPLVEVEPAEPKLKKAKAKAAAKSTSSRHGDDEDDDDEDNIVPVDVNAVVEKTLRVKRWTKQDEPFKGFDSPPGRF